MTDPTHTRRAVGLAAAAVFAAALIASLLQDTSTAVAAAHEASTLHALAQVVSRFGLSGYMLAGSAATALGAVLLRRAEPFGRGRGARLVAERALLVFAAVAVSGLMCQAIKHVVGRARPRFFAQWGAFHFDGPGFRSGMDSFPSGHATSAFAAAVALGLCLPRWRRPLLALAVLVCAARVMAGAHYSSDTVAGAFLGSAVAVWMARSFAARDMALPPPGRPLRGALPGAAPERAAP